MLLAQQKNRLTDNPFENLKTIRQEICSFYEVYAYLEPRSSNTVYPPFNPKCRLSKKHEVK